MDKINTYSKKNNELFKKYTETLSKSIKDLLIQNNLGLVGNICKKHLWSGKEYDDLFQIGCIGLIKSINNFNISYNFEFSTYAFHIINGEIKRFLRDDTILHIGRETKENLRKLNYFKSKLTALFECEPCDEELSEAMEIDINEVRELQRISYEINVDHMSRVVYQSDDGEVLLQDNITDGKDDYEVMIDRNMIRDMFGLLKIKEEVVIKKRYFEDKTQVQVAKELRTSQVQISRLEKKAIGKMKKCLVN